MTLDKLTTELLTLQGSARAEFTMKYLARKRINAMSGNKGIHIRFTTDTHKVDLWITTFKLWLTELESGKKRTINSVINISDFLFNL